MFFSQIISNAPCFDSPFSERRPGAHERPSGQEWQKNHAPVIYPHGRRTGQASGMPAWHHTHADDHVLQGTRHLPCMHPETVSARTRRVRPGGRLARRGSRHRTCSASRHGVSVWGTSKATARPAGITPEGPACRRLASACLEAELGSDRRGGRAPGAGGTRRAAACPRAHYMGRHRSIGAEARVIPLFLSFHDGMMIGGRGSEKR